MTIHESLIKIFKDHKVVICYDSDKSMYEEFQNLELGKVKKHEVINNEFSVKHIIYTSQKEDQFLLYFPYPVPAHTDNWLLDLQLAHRVFNTDQEAMFLQDMGLDYDLKYLVKAHLEFFKNKDRRNMLLDLISEGESENDIRFKMLAVVFNTNFPTLESYVQSYANTFINDDLRVEKELNRFNLNSVFWKAVAKKFGYHSEDPSIYDFLFDTFSRNFSITNKGRSTKETRILLSLWKDAISFQDAFKRGSDKIAEDLRIENLLQATSYSTIQNDDLFKVIDLKIISDLGHALANDSISLDELLLVYKERKNKYWYTEYEHFYEALFHAAQLITLVKQIGDSTIDSIQSACNLYAQDLYRIDLHYRKYLLYFRKIQQNRVLDPLTHKICNLYTNDWLLRINDALQRAIEQENKWIVNSHKSQNKFYKNNVQPFISKSNRLFVIISDALRYENGVQLVQELQAEKRYEAEIDYMTTLLPCYTQLGMAALLPHKQLSINPLDCNVIVDGKKSSGTLNRSKILNNYSDARAIAIASESFMKMNAATEGRVFAKEHDLIYIYNNRIDKVGDDKMTEDRVFEAVEEEIAYLKEMLKKIANMNGNHVLITADHGYIYQHEQLEESEFSESNVKGEVWKENRRFILGKGVSASNAMHKFTGDQVGVNSETDVLITKSINRLRVKGAGSRFVHGGG